MRVLVCGGREFDDVALVLSTLSGLDPQPTHLIHGGASGADSLADYWAKCFGVSVSRYAADWEGRGRSAGVLRNQQMLDSGKPDLVIAFPGGRGTADMVRRARRAGIHVREVPARPVEPGHLKDRFFSGDF